MIISLIAAVSKNYVIGKDGMIPWKIRGEQKRFKELTLGKIIIMGRTSYEEIGRPLPGSKIIIISKTKVINGENCCTIPSLEEAFRLVKDEEEVFIAGGGRLYKDTISFADRIYLTVIDKVIERDVSFPYFNMDDYEMVYKQRVEGDIPFTYYTFEKRISRGIS